MTALTAMFFLLILVDGQPPYEFRQEMPLQECLFEVDDIMSKQSAALQGARIQAGCSITVPRSLPASIEAEDLQTQQ